MSEELFHVMKLEPAQQDAIWLLIYNLHAGFILKQMSHVASFDDDDKVNARHELVLDSLDTMLGIMDLIMDSGHKTKTLAFNQGAMSYIELAVKEYDLDSDECQLDPPDRMLVNREMGALRPLIANSAKFEYTRLELKKVGIV
jgi:hypothetical protein